MDGEDRVIRKFKDRLRIFLILYFFSDKYEDESNPHYRRVFKSEVKIQKIDFLIRYPDYLAYELLNVAKGDISSKGEIRNIVKHIFECQEPTLRHLEMERFFFGAYEDIDDVISFLKSIGFIDFTSKRNAKLNIVEKNYYITDYAISKVENTLKTLTSLQWYFNRCGLIKRYFGDLSGTQLRINQYQIDEYKNTAYGDYIGGIQELVKNEYKLLYGERLL